MTSAPTANQQLQEEREKRRGRAKIQATGRGPYRRSRHRVRPRWQYRTMEARSQEATPDAHGFAARATQRQEGQAALRWSARVPCRSHPAGCRRCDAQDGRKEERRSYKQRRKGHEHGRQRMSRCIRPESFGQLYCKSLGGSNPLSPAAADEAGMNQASKDLCPSGSPCG